MRDGLRRLAPVGLVAGLALALPPLAGAGGGGPAAHRADGKLRDGVGKPTMLGGRTQISRGELIHTDYLYDDYGPDHDGFPDPPPFRSNLAPRRGDFGYPDDPERYGNNGADLRELRLALDRRRLHALIALQTMKVADAAVATIAIDADGDPATGAGTWPDGAGLRAPGADVFITASGDEGRLTDAAGEQRATRARTNSNKNVIEVAVKRRKLGPLEPGARVWVAVGLAAPGAAFQPQGEAGETAAFDLGFQGAESYGYFDTWSDGRQAAALADGDVSGFSERLRPRALRAGKTKRFRLVPGYYNRIFRSRNSYGEGIDLKGGSFDSEASTRGSAAPMFLGRYQPYGLYVPEGYRRKRGAPLLIDGHSLDHNLNQYAAVGTNQLRQLGDQRGSLIITPLGRGIDSWYLDAGLVDVLEAWDDVEAHYKADPERTSLTGYSMGGYLTYRLGLLMPDAFVRASSYVGPPAYYFWPYPLPLQSTPEWEVRGNTNLIVENGLNLPYEIVAGALDDLVPIAGVIHQANTFRAAGNPYRFYNLAADGHLTFIVAANEWSRTRDWLGTGRRERSPVRVRYVRYPSMDLPHAGLRFDGAYWVDRMKVRDADEVTDHGRIDATTFARGGRLPRLVDDGTAVDVGGAGVSPAVRTGQHLKPGEPIAERNEFTATLENLRGVTLRSGRMGLEVGRRVRATLTGDGVTKLRFTGRWPKRMRASLDGDRARLRHRPDGSIVVHANLAGPGEHQLVVARR